MAASFLSSALEELEWAEDRRQASWEARVDWEDWLDMYEACRDFEEEREKVEEFQAGGWTSDEKMWDMARQREKVKDGLVEMRRRYERWEARRLHASSSGTGRFPA